MKAVVQSALGEPADALRPVDEKGIISSVQQLPRRYFNMSQHKE